METATKVPTDQKKAAVREWLEDQLRYAIYDLYKYPIVAAMRELEAGSDKEAHTLHTISLSIEAPDGRHDGLAKHAVFFVLVNQGVIEEFPPTRFSSDKRYRLTGKLPADQGSVRLDRACLE